MNQIFKWACYVASIGWVVSAFAAEPVQTLNLKQFTNSSPFDRQGIAWLLPQGRQVLDGTPFELDGMVTLFGTSAGQKWHLGKTNVDDIPVGRRFERLHLLAAVETAVTNSVVIAKIHLNYADGSQPSTLEVRCMDDVGDWFAPRHETNAPPRNNNSHEAWRGQASVTAKGDKYVRLYQVTLANPAPEKEVRSLSLESTKKKSALMIAAMSVGPVTAAPEPDTITPPKHPLPDLAPRLGRLVAIEGTVKDQEGKFLPGVGVRVIAARELKTDDGKSKTDNPNVGIITMTGTDGRFILPPLPDDRLYRLLFVREGFNSSVYRGADPAGDPIEIRLTAVRPADLKYAVRGRVVGPDGKPVAWVPIETDGIATDESRGWGMTHGFAGDIFTLTNGEFTLSRAEPFKQVQVDINAPGLAPAHLWLDVTNETQVIELGIGALLTGRVMKDGKPLADMRVGVSGTDRNSEVYAGNYETRTDTNGVFRFEHLQPNTSWQFYGLMESFKKLGALSPREARSSGHGETTDLGEVQVVRGLRLAGQVKTRHGEKLPKGIKLNVGFDTAWDSQNIPVDGEGRFALEGLSKGLVNVWVGENAWRLSAVNRSLSEWNPGELTGLLEENKTDLLVMIEKGQRRYQNYWNGNGQLPPQDQPQSRPLSGAEPSGGPSIVLAGQIVDDKTGQPIAKCEVIPGRKPAMAGAPLPGQQPLLKHMLEPFAKKQTPWNERIYWAFQHSETFSNGVFSLEFIPLSSLPILQVKAEGYEPLETEAMSMTTTNLVLRLKQGHGPNGVVLEPDGTPAEKATVIYAAKTEQFSMNHGSLGAYGEDKQKQQQTGKDGKFSFLARAEGVVLFVSHPSGWAEAAVERGGDNLKLRLKPWAVLRGTLVSTNGTPMPGVPLQLTMYHDWQRGGALVNFQGQTNTDATGHFEIRNVPPRRVEIQRTTPMGRGSWSSTLQTWVVAEPGTNELGNITYDKPPAEPMLEQLKQRFGL